MTTSTSEVEEIIGIVEISGIGTGMLTAGNDDEGTKTFLEAEDDGKVNISNGMMEFFCFFTPV